jgi:hypothetical protein
MGSEFQETAVIKNYILNYGFFSAMNPERLLISGAAFTIMGLSNAVIPILLELADLNPSS